MNESDTQPLGSRILFSLIVWAGVIALVVAAKFALTQLPPINIPLIRSEFAWATIGVYAAIGGIGVLLAAFINLPPPLGGNISAVTRFIGPLLIGAVLAIAAILIDRVTHGTDFLAQQTGQPTFNVEYPQSLFVYSAGAVLAESVFRLLPLPLLLLLTYAFVKSPEGRARGFVVIALLVALFEPVLQGGGIIALGGGDKQALFMTQFLPYFVTSYPLNLAACFAYRDGGFLSPIATRLGFYLVWHIVYGNFLYQPA
jgi:hypothetical protein